MKDGLERTRQEIALALRHLEERARCRTQEELKWQYLREVEEVCAIRTGKGGTGC